MILGYFLVVWVRFTVSTMSILLNSLKMVLILGTRPKLSKIYKFRIIFGKSTFLFDNHILDVNLM